uniref:Uncharacterized protein n=1 Tax=Anguilla anguilla TaxID=7936 RepID=A0A0E9XT99_ANGAN
MRGGHGYPGGGVIRHHHTRTALTGQ